MNCNHDYLIKNTELYKEGKLPNYCYLYGGETDLIKTTIFEWFTCLQCGKQIRKIIRKNGVKVNEFQS